MRSIGGSGSDDGTGARGVNNEPSEPSADDWFPLVELAGRIAELVWVEQSLAELYEAWSAFEPHSGARILLAQASRHHAWHAEVLTGCLPTSPQLGEQATPRPPTQGWADAITMLRSIDAADQSPARLAAIVRQLDPWLVRETTALLDLARPVADAHLTRWLRFIEIDHHDDGAAMAELLDALQANTISLRDRSLLGQIDLRRDVDPTT